MSRRVLLAAFAMLLALAADAQQHPNQKKGFNPHDVYQFNGLDSINAFNGNLTLSIPIGGEYSVGGGLTYSFVLHSNANLWEAEQHCHKNSLGHCIQVCPSSDKTCSVAQPTDPTYMYPHRRANAGLGWTLSFGRLYPPEHTAVGESSDWTWESPSGADHSFQDRYAAVSYSALGEDPSYLRMSLNGDGTRSIEFPDGTVHIYGAPDTLNDFWTLKRITNRFQDNFVDFAYEAIASPAGQRWTITDSHGRSHIVELQKMQHDRFQRNFVKKVALSVYVEPDAATPARAETVFGYTPRSVRRPYDHNDDFNDSLHGAVSDYAPTQLLTSITFPDSTSYQFSYQEGSDLNGAGYPLSMTLPTGGSVHWEWNVYGKPWSSADTSEPYLRYSLGVTGRKMLDRLGVWLAERTYQSGGDCSFEDQDEANNLCLELVNTITEKIKINNVIQNGTKTAHYFSVARPVLGTPAHWSELEYGKPFTKKVADGTAAPATRWLSSRTLDANGGVLRSNYVRYDWVSSPAYGSSMALQQASSRLVFHDDTIVDPQDGNVKPYLDTDSSGWDGYGHYRTVTTSGNFPNTPTRVVTTNFLPPQTAWLTGLYDFQTVEENGTTFRTEYCFSPITGFLTRKRTLKQAVRGPSDLLAVYVADSRGNVATESYYGGDTLSAIAGSDGALCGATPGPKAYEITHTRAEPTASTDGSIVSKYPVPNVEIETITIDRRSGRVAKVTDAAGVATSFEYDWAGRVTWEKPDGRAWSRYEYLPSGTYEIRATRYPNGTGSGTPLAWSKYEVDGFGRVTRERVAMPGGGESWRFTTYDELGRNKTVSELGDAAVLPVTTFTYDALGRVKKVEAPGASVTDFEYSGARLKSRLSSIRTGSGDAVVKTTEKYDGYGRLVEVTENAAVPGSSTRTEYQYNPANNLSTVTMHGAGATVQNRVFDYDGRGFLRWESHPESGVSSYSYDARAHMRSKEVGAAKTTFDLSYDYDAAERLTAVNGRTAQNSTLFRPIKEFVYASQNATVNGIQDKRAGKLVTAVRHNYPPGNAFERYMTGGVIKVTESYRYLDLAGRKTDRTTSVALTEDGQSWTTIRDFTQSTTYNALDAPATTVYPLCVDCGLPREEPDRTITSTYDRGYLTSLSDFVSSINYWPNGARKDMVHSNSIVDKQVIDTNNMLPRPKSLTSEQYCVAPVITALTQDVTVASPPAQLSVTAAGAGLSYQWYSLGQAIPGATSATYAAPAAGSYYVVVTNSCGTTYSKYVTVTVGSCVAPSVQTVSATRTANGTFVLRASARGTAPITYQWYVAGSSTPFATGAEVVTAAITATTEYTVSASNSCGPAATRTVLAVVPLTFPPGQYLTATVQGSGISVYWPVVAGNGVTYALERRAAGTPWGLLAGALSTNSYFDAAVSAQQAYAYRVVARDSGGAASPASHADVAFLATFTSITAGSPVDASQFEQLLSAVNAMRSVAGWSSITWAGMLSSSDPLPFAGNGIVAKHMLGLRLRLNEALQALGVPINGYSDCAPQQPIRAQHLTELQQRVK